jgi:hypothetical protein
MSSYRFWVERHKLSVWLESEKSKLVHLQEAERKRRTMEIERDFRVKLDEIYGRVRLEFEPAKA